MPPDPIKSTVKGCFSSIFWVFYFIFIDEFDAEVFDEDIVSEGEEEVVSVIVPAAKKHKKTFNPDALANAFQSVLRQNLPQEKAESDNEKEDDKKETEQPVAILAKSKAMEDLEEAQIDYRARKILKAQIRSTKESIHFSEANAPETLNFERSLRKLATRGVVQLFNAIQTSQQQKDEDKRVKRQEKLAEAQRNLPTMSNGNDAILPLASSSASYFDFLKKQQQQKSL